MISGFRRGVYNLILSIILSELEQELRYSSVRFSFMYDPRVKPYSCVQRAPLFVLRSEVEKSVNKRTRWGMLRAVLYKMCVGGGVSSV